MGFKTKNRIEKLEQEMKRLKRDIEYLKKFVDLPANPFEKLNTQESDDVILEEIWGI